MTTRTKRLLWAFVIAFVLLWLSLSFLSYPAQARPAGGSRIVATPHTWRRNSVPGVCPKYPNGVLAGWTWGFTERSWPTGVVQYRFGDWAGSYCSNHRHIWAIRWGGVPDGFAQNTVGWVWDVGDTKIVESDYSGMYRFRKWRSHFHIYYAPFAQRHDYPWLYIGLAGAGHIDMKRGCSGGCG